MRYLLTFIVFFSMLSLNLSAQELSLKSGQDSISYAFGMNLGFSFQQQSIEVKPNIVAAGLVAAYTGAGALLSKEEVGQILVKFQQEMTEKRNAERTVSGKKNLEEGKTFLAENAKKEGVSTTASGLQYLVVEEGKGEKPSLESTVKVHYRGTLLSGKEFDSSYKRGEPATFPLKGVIKGWTEALQLMTVGSKWKLFIPADLAYGEGGAGADIGPNSALIFDVELIGIEK